MAADYLFEAYVLYSQGDATVAKNASGGQLLDKTTLTAVPIYDTNGTPIAGLTSNSDGVGAPFRADVMEGIIDFGGIQFPIFSRDANSAGVNTAYAAAQAATAASQATGAANMAVSSAASAGQAALDAEAAAALVGAPAGSAIDAHLGGDSTSVVADIVDLQTQPQTIAQLPPGSQVTATFTGGAWYCGGVLLAARPTARTDIHVHLLGGTEADDPGWTLTGDYWDRTA